ncbi:MAG: hypothetical protein HYS06_01885 [Methylocystis sp.]|nr:hypothetical protein [Methylocystis sp.]
MIEPSVHATPMEAAAIRALSKAEASLLLQLGRLVRDDFGTYRLRGSVPDEIISDQEDFEASRFVEETEAISLHALSDDKIRNLWCKGLLVKDCTGFRFIDPPKPKPKLWEKISLVASLAGTAAFLIGLGGLAIVGFGEAIVETLVKLRHLRLGDIAEIISMGIAFIALSAGCWWLMEGRRR